MKIILTKKEGDLPSCGGKKDIDCSDIDCTRKNGTFATKLCQGKVFKGTVASQPSSRDRGTELSWDPGPRSNLSLLN